MQRLKRLLLQAAFAAPLIDRERRWHLSRGVKRFRLAFIFGRALFRTEKAKEAPHGSLAKYAVTRVYIKIRALVSMVNLLIIADTPL